MSIYYGVCYLAKRPDGSVVYGTPTFAVDPDIVCLYTSSGGFSFHREDFEKIAILAPKEGDLFEEIANPGTVWSVFACNEDSITLINEPLHISACLVWSKFLKDFTPTVTTPSWKHGYCQTCQTELTPALDNIASKLCFKHDRRV